MHADALSSFKSQIRANKAIIDKNQYLTNANEYCNDGNTFVHDSKETNEIAMDKIDAERKATYPNNKSINSTCSSD